MRTDHLLTLVDDCGIVQHANGAIPNRPTGYCVDDVARLAVVALELERRTGDRVWSAALYRALAFLVDASDADGAGMRNFMSYDRRWLDEPHVGDHVGRAVWALGDVLTTAWVPALVDPAQRLLASLVRSLAGDLSLRTAAYTSLGLARLDADRLDDGARLLLERCVAQLETAYDGSAGDGWNWFEDSLTYDNARLSQALILGGTALERDAAVEAGLSSLAWLGDECGLADGFLRLPGHQGRQRGEPAPVSATSNRSTRRRSSRPSCRRSRSPAMRSTARARSARSTGSSAGTGSAARSTTSPPAAAATASARTTSTPTKARSRRWRSTAPNSCWTPPGLPRVVRLADATIA